MEMQEPELDYEEEDYQSTSTSSETDFFSELLLADSDEKFIDIIMKLKSDNEKFLSVYNSFKDYNEKKRTSSRLKSIQNRLAKLLSNLKQNDRYAETESQKAILWFMKRFCIHHLLGPTKQIQAAYTQIFSEFTSFQDFLYFIQQVGDIRIIFKKSLFNERLHYLYQGKYDKLEKQDTKMKFAQTMKTLDEERKLIVKAEIIYYFRQYITTWNIEIQEIEQILNVLADKPYEKLFESLLNKQVKAIKNLRISILKSKIELKDGKSEIVFGPKCQLHNDLKTKEIFELTAKKCDGSELIPLFDPESLIVHGDYLYTKWSQDIVISAKQRVGYGTARLGLLNETFLKLLQFFKKVFENRNKHILFLGEQTKMIEQESQGRAPKETIDYICHSLQLLVKFLGFNSIDINHREQNLSDLFTPPFLEELCKFFEEQLKGALILEEESKQMKDDKKPKNIILETVDYLVTLALHLFYRRDFQAITAITSKVSQTLLRILLTLPNFPIKWTTLRNYKLVMDRWGESVEEGSADFKLLIGKFLSAYFNEKVVVASKSSSAVFNPRNASKAYYNLFGSELVKFVESLEKQMDQLNAENSNSPNIAREMNVKVSKIIFFLVTRARYSQLGKMAEHLSNIYKKYAHIVPDIYLFRTWISQFPSAKLNFAQVSQKLSQCSKLMLILSDKISTLSTQQLLTPVLNLNQQQFSQIITTVNLYKSIHSKAMNMLQIKPKKQQLGQQVIKSLLEITRKHVQLFYSMYAKGKEFQALDKQSYNLLIQQNQLSYRNDNESIFLTIQQTKKNLLGLVRFFICNGESLLSTKDYSAIVGELGEWFRDVVVESQDSKDNQKLTFLLRNMNITICHRLPTGFKCHLMKPQFLAISRSLTAQFNLNKTQFIPFNQVIAFYQQIKPVYSKFIKLLIQTKMSQKSKTKSQAEFNEACNQMLEYAIFPGCFIGGQCNFNGRLENKATENMVLGVYLEQAQVLAKDFSIDEFLHLNDKYPIMKMLKITQDKQSKITQQKAGRSGHGGLFAGGRGGHHSNRLFDGLRPDRSTTQFRNQLMQYGYTQDQIQIALQNIGVPDPQLATQWIENNQQTIQNLLIEKAIRQSKQETMMKQKIQTKVEAGKVAPIAYGEFKDKLKESMDGLVKTLWRQLFDHELEKGKKMADLVFVIIDVFKTFYKTNQYLNFSKKMFSEIQAMNDQVKKPEYKFDDKKYRLVLYVLNFTLKRQAEVFKNYYKDKDGICLRILGLVPLFGKSSTTQEQKKKEKSEDFKILIEIINKTLPEWKNPPQQVKSELVDYLNTLLNLIKISNLGNKDVWQILYKISLLQLPQLREKIINLFSNIVLSKQILQAERQLFKQENKPLEKEKRNIFYKAPKKTLPQKVYMLPLVKILLEHEKQLLVSNIELEIKGYIVEQYKKEIIEMNEKDEAKRLPLEIDLKKFSFAFEKFIGCAEFEKVFKKLFSKKKNKKGTLFYDFTKHPLYMSEFADESTQQPFISVKYGALVEQILQTMISRPLQFEEEERQLQQESLITLYKFLDYFKVLIPTALRTKFISPKTQKPMTLLQWLVCESVALNEKKYHFMTFLSMNNNLFVNEKQAISDWVSNEYIAIFRREIDAFSQYLKLSKQSEMIENNSDIIFKQESQQELRFKKVMFHFMYLLQVEKFNAQCFLKTADEKSVRDQIQSLFLNVTPVQQPILYTLLSEIIFILRKREMIELLKDKYEIQCPEVVAEQNQLANLNRSQFLTMSLIFDVDQPTFGDSSYMIKGSRRRNIFSGSSGRIIVDEVDDQEFDDEEMDWDELQARAEVDDQALGFMGFRGMRNDQRNSRLGQSGDAFLFPSESYRLASQSISIQNQEPQQSSNENQQQKIQEEPTNIKQKPKPLSPTEYAEMLKKQSDTLVQTLKVVQNLLPHLRSLDRTPFSKQKLQEIKEQKMVPQDQGRQVEGFTEFVQSLSALDQKVKEKISLISVQNGNFDPNNEITPEFICRLSFKENISKLAKFEKRFKSMIIALCPEIQLSIWQNNHGEDQKGSGQKKLRAIPNARELLQRLERESNVENRDRMINSIESILNLGRSESRQEDNRPRNINLHEAFQSLPQQPEPPKQEQKPKSEQKQPQKPQSQVKVQVKPEKSQVQQKHEQKIIEQKPEQKAEQKMQQQKPVESTEQKVEEKPVVNENQMNIEEQQKPLEPEPIMPQQFPLVQQPPVIQQPQPQVMSQPGPYRQILAMFGLPQSYLVDNGIDLQSFDSLPEQLQIDQLQHYMSQAQNRMAINQLNQANQPVQQNASQQQQGESQNGQQPQQQQQGGTTGVNDVLQDNIALFASMDPETRMQMLVDYPPQFLMQLPVQMRTQVQQYRQRQLRRIVSQQEDQNFYGLREQLINQGNRKKDNKKELKKEDAKYPLPDELSFNPVEDSLAEHLAKSIFLKIQKAPMLDGFKFLLQNYLTQDGALATIIGILNCQDGLKSIQLERKPEQDNKKNSQKSESSIVLTKKDYWKVESVLLSDVAEINRVRQMLLNLVLDMLNQSLYKNPDFLMKKVPFKNYLNLNIQIDKELQADEDGFWPLYQLLPFSLTLSNKLSVQILKKVKSLPLKLIKLIVKSIREDKISTEIYKNLDLLSKNEDMKRIFMQEFPEQRPLKLQTFAKVIKYEFARVPYLKKLHQEALNCYSADYNQFLNQIFGIYTTEDIKQIQPILAKHKHIHFQVIKYLYSQNRMLQKQPMGLILKMPHLLDFQTKKHLFRKHPKIRRVSRYRLPIQVHRDGILLLQQSFNQIMSKTPKQLQGRLQVTFMDEQGYDAGGLTREWLLCLSREIFNPNYALFEPSSSGNTYQPNPKSYINPDHLQYFKFIGRLIGKALAQNQLVDAYFTRAFYKMVLGQQIQLSDIQQQDYPFYNSMLWLKQNPIEQGDYTFSYLYDNFGQRIVKDLIPGGRDIKVNEENKQQYIQKYCLAKMRDDFKVQIQKFLQGFHEIIPHECISFFQAKQLQLLISGLPTIDFKDLKNNVDYSGFSPTDQVIRWFWEVLEEFTQEDLARLIQFITGTSKIPVDGFANIKGMNGPQRISIHKDPNVHQLPKAHTCFNQLDLPSYPTKQIMRERIVTAITWGSQGFGFM